MMLERTAQQTHQKERLEELQAKASALRAKRDRIRAETDAIRVCKEKTYLFVLIYKQA